MVTFEVTNESRRKELCNGIFLSSTFQNCDSICDMDYMYYNILVSLSLSLTSVHQGFFFFFLVIRVHQGLCGKICIYYGMQINACTIHMHCVVYEIFCP